MTRFFLGGPAYNSKIDVRHASCFAQMVISIVKANDGLEAMHYVHNSVLPQGRAQWLGAALDSGADVAVTMDADTWIADRKGGACGGEMLYDLASNVFRMLADHDFHPALVGVLVPQRDGRVNAWKADGVRLESGDGYEVRHRRGWHLMPHPMGALGEAEDKRPSGERAVRCWPEVHSVGLACAIYNLAWWRASGIQGGERNAFAMIPGKGEAVTKLDDPRARYAFVGEDVFHCGWLRMVGGGIAGVDLGAIHGGW